MLLVLGAGLGCAGGESAVSSDLEPGRPRVPMVQSEDGDLRVLRPPTPTHVHHIRKQLFNHTEKKISVVTTGN